MRQYIRALSCLGLAAILAPSVVSPVAADAFAVDSSSIFASVFNQTVAFRQANGLPKLIFSGRVYPIAQEYADYLAANNTGGHEADGRTPAQRVAARGLKYCGVAENVYEIWTSPGYPSLQQAIAGAMDFWMRSPGHRANLLNANMKLLGVGSAGWSHEGRNYVKIVQVFVDDCLPIDRPKRLGG